MASEDEYTGVIREKSLEPGDYQQQKPRNNHHKKLQLCTKNSTKIVLFAIAAALSCFILVRSSSSYNFGNFIVSSSHYPLPTFDGQSSHGNHGRPSSHDDHTHGKLMKRSSTRPADFEMGNSSINSKPFPTDFMHGNASYSSPPAVTNSGPENNKKSSVEGNINASRPVGNENGDKELEKVLKRAATENKTVIITTLNSAWIAPNSIFDLFLESFKIGHQTKGLLNHMVVVALDQKAYSFCIEMHPHCYALTTHGVDFSGEAFFMSVDYLKMMWRRIDFLRIVLDLGYSFIFTDADVMWFRNPFSHFYSDTDFQIACDHYWYASTDLDNSPNGGFNHVRSNYRTVQFYTFWYNSKEKYPGRHDQDVLNMIKYDPFIKEIGLSIRFLDTARFGGFCEPSKDLNQVCTMHANCCIGMENKIHDLKMLIEDWRNYMAMPNEQKILDPAPTWTVPRICG